MKACTVCHRLFPDEGTFCSVDGQPLTATAEMATPADAQDSRVGSKVCGGRYHIWRKIADGGMGRVYQAIDLLANRAVALKILHTEVAEDAVAVERFKREFEVSTSLPHEYIVDVLAFEKIEGNSFVLVMEFLEGEELRTVLKREKVIPAERVVRMLSQVAIGLAAAHEHKIVHRDLKPDNIFLCGTRDGDIAKILDFGSVRDNSEGAKKLTVMGTTIGSPYYMAPEQAQGLEELDQRADVWSLAAIAYESLTGKVPFEGSTGPAILLAIMTAEPKPPSQVGQVGKAGKVSSLPATLDPVIEDALAKSPAARTNSIGALADRVGAAFGLEGTHHDWARVPQDELGERIRTRLPGALEAFENEKKAQADVSAMDKAFRSDDAFKAGSVGGPSALINPLVGEVAMEEAPKGIPKWILPVVAAVAILVGAAVAFLVAR